MFHIHDYIHGPISHYFKNKEMDELYVSIGIKALAQSIIQIFIPIYLLNGIFSSSGFFVNLVKIQPRHN